MDEIDRRLLELLQRDLPLEPSPFAALGERLGLAEGDVLARTRRLKEDGLIRQIGPIFDSRQLGYRSTLVAWAVAEERLEGVARQVSASPAVSHCYARAHRYNLWFTLTLPPGEDLPEQAAAMAAENGIGDYLDLPAVRTFKIGVYLPLTSGGTDDGAAPGVTPAPAEPAPPVALSSLERELVRTLQGDLPLVERPFADVASRMQVDEQTVLAGIGELRRRGVLRRLAAVLRHRRAGYAANGMACWAVPEERIIQAGQFAASQPQVSHCYQRPAYPPRWSYSLFTMIHGHERSEVEAVVERIRAAIAPDEHTVLYSGREFKKERVRYTL